MKRNVTLVVVLAVLVGCFGRPVDVSVPSAPERKEEVKASPVATQETLNQLSTPAPQSPVATTESPIPVPVVAQDSEMKVSDVEVGDPALESAIRFAVDRAGTVSVRPEIMEGLRLFQVRTNQYGQTELIGNIDGTRITLPAAGTYLVAGREKPLPFMDVPLGGDNPSVAQYRVQTEDCIPGIRELERSYGGFPARSISVTRDTQFPVKAKVYFHRGAGNSENPADSFRNWVEYNQSSSPDKAALAERVREYVPDPWDSDYAPNVAASRRKSCGTPGEVWLDVCHSAGCLRAWLAILDVSDWHNNAGVIAFAPAFGGSHHAIDALSNAALSKLYGVKAIRWGVIRTVIRWEWGMLIPPSSKKIFLQDVLAGPRFSLQNEGARALAWDGIGTGIPTENYYWFSWSNFGIPYLPLRLKPEVKYSMPWNNALSKSAPGSYVWPEDGKMFNYVEAVRALDGQIPYRTDGRFDVAVSYMNGDLKPAIAKFEESYGKDSVLETLWRGLTSAEYRRAFGKAALPWLNSLTARSPSVVSSDPELNENAIGDGALTACQQIGCLEGESILAPGSKYGALIINMAVVKERTPHYAGEVKFFEGDHGDAVKGGPEQWDWANKRVITRIDRMREQERSYVLSDEDKRRIMTLLGPRDGEETLYTDYSGGVHRTKTVWRLHSTQLKWTQDSLGTGQRNRILLVGTGRMTQDIYRYSSSIKEYVFDFQASKTLDWIVNEDFVVRNGALMLVVND